MMNLLTPQWRWLSRHPFIHNFSQPFDELHQCLEMQARGRVGETSCEGYEFLYVSKVRHRVFDHTFRVANKLDRNPLEPPCMYRQYLFQLPNPNPFQDSNTSVSSPTIYTTEWVDLENDIFAAPAPDAICRSHGLRLALSVLDFPKIRKLAIEFNDIYRRPSSRGGRSCNESYLHSTGY